MLWSSLSRGNKACFIGRWNQEEVWWSSKQQPSSQRRYWSNSSGWVLMVLLVPGWRTVCDCVPCCMFCCPFPVWHSGNESGVMSGCVCEASPAQLSFISGLITDSGIVLWYLCVCVMNWTTQRSSNLYEDNQIAVWLDEVMSRLTCPQRSVYTADDSLL